MCSCTQLLETDSDEVIKLKTIVLELNTKEVLALQASPTCGNDYTSLAFPSPSLH